MYSYKDKSFNQSLAVLELSFLETNFAIKLSGKLPSCIVIQWAMSLEGLSLRATKYTSPCGLLIGKDNRLEALDLIFQHELDMKY